MAGMTNDSLVLGQIFELDASDQIGTLLSFIRAERLRRGQAAVDPSRVTRCKPLDPRDLMVAELEQFGLSVREINALENFLCRQLGTAVRDRIDCLTVCYLCLFSPSDLRSSGEFTEGAINRLRRVLYNAGQSYRPAKKVSLRGDQSWRPSTLTNFDDLPNSDS